MEINAVTNHYAKEPLAEKILGLFKQSGKNPEQLTREDLGAVDEFHLRGRDATRSLATRAVSGDRMKLLDLGSGIGGPARTLAAEFGCNVVGLDPVEEHVRTAQVLTGITQLEDRVTFQQGSALDIPFPPESFDMVWMQHANMNIADKLRLLDEIGRVLRSGGTFAFYEIFAGSQQPIHFPVPWAEDTSISFLEPFETFRRKLHELGFEETFGQDVTTACLRWAEGVIERIAGQSGPPAPGVHLLMGPNAKTKIENVRKNLTENRIAVHEAVFRRSGR